MIVGCKFSVDLALLGRGLLSSDSEVWMWCTKWVGVLLLVVFGSCMEMSCDSSCGGYGGKVADSCELGVG